MTQLNISQTVEVTEANMEAVSEQWRIPLLDLVWAYVKCGEKPFEVLILEDVDETGHFLLANGERP